MSTTIQARLVREARARLHGLSADEQNAFKAADQGLLDEKYATSDVDALIAAAQALVTAHGTAMAVADLDDEVDALETALDIATTPGGV